VGVVTTTLAIFEQHLSSQGHGLAIMPDVAFEKLTEGNYADWKMRMEALLVEKDLWGVVDRSITEPLGAEGSPAKKAFRKKQAHARAKIVLHVEKECFPYTRDQDPAIIWDGLARVFRAQGFGSLLTLRHSFWNLRKQDNQSMRSWVAAVKSAAFLLEDSDAAIEDLDIIICLVQSLPDTYSAVVTYLDSLPIISLTVDSVVAHLISEESRQNDSPVHDSGGDAITMFAAATFRNRKFKNRRVCHRCGGMGHLQLECPSEEIGVKKERAAVAAGEGDFSDDASW